MPAIMGYPGSKTGTGVWQAIVAQMPPHDCYIETHLGSGAILARKPPADRQIGIDLDADTIAHSRRRLRSTGAELVTGRAESFLASFDYAAAGRVLIYCDPPYLRGPGEIRGGRRLYRHEYDQADHVRLLTLLKRLPASIIISGYPSRLYDKHLKGWRAVEIQAMTRGGPRTEKLWLNFPPGAVQWASLAGNNFTQRQHRKRQAARWAARFKAMDGPTRCAVMAALLEAAESPIAQTG